MMMMMNWTELNVYWHACSKNSWIAEYKIIKTVWSKAIQSTDTIKYNDKTIYTDTVQLELKLGDKRGGKYVQR